MFRALRVYPPLVSFPTGVDVVNVTTLPDCTTLLRLLSWIAHVVRPTACAKMTSRLLSFAPCWKRCSQSLLGLGGFAHSVTPAADASSWSINWFLRAR